MEEYNVENVEQLKEKLNNASRELVDSVRGEIELRYAIDKVSNEKVFLREWLCRLLVEHGHYDSYDAAHEHVLSKQRSEGDSSYVTR